MQNVFFFRSEVAVKYYKIQRPRSKAREWFSFNLSPPGLRDQGSSADERQRQLGCGSTCSTSRSQPLPALRTPPHPTDLPLRLSYIARLTLTANTPQGLNKCSKLDSFFSAGFHWILVFAKGKTVTRLRHQLKKRVVIIATVSMLPALDVTTGRSGFMPWLLATTEQSKARALPQLRMKALPEAARALLFGEVVFHS